MTECKRAEALATFAREHGWAAETRDDTIGGDRVVALQLTGIWGEPGDLDWQWGYQLVWFKTDADWRLGVSEGGWPAPGVAIGRDEVEHTFSSHSLKQVRKNIEDPAHLVAKFDEWWPKAKDGPTVETRVGNVLRRMHSERLG